MSPLYRRNERNRPHMWLQALRDRTRPPIAAENIAILVAQPGDEAIGCGAQLPRLRDAAIIVLTDGTPRDFSAANREQLEAAEAHAATRLKELERALKFAGLGLERLLLCGTSDRQAAQQLAALVRQIAAHIQRNNIRCLLTLAYEGAHPDRDATAFVAHLAAELLSKQQYRLHLMEMPIAHQGPYGVVTQRFIEDPATMLDGACELELTEEERNFKRALFDIYTTQRDVLSLFDARCELFRAAPTYDFGAPPNWGRVLYEQQIAGRRCAPWLTLAHEALQEFRMTSSWC